jgi:hypothetical protein
MLRAIAAGLVVSLLVATASAAVVDVDVGDKLVYTGQSHAQGQGGEFTFDLFKFNGTASQATPGGSYSWDGTAIKITTFCGEIDQYIYLNDAAYVTNIDDASNSSLVHSLTDLGEWVFWGYNTDDEGYNIVPDIAGSSNPIDTPVFTNPPFSGTPPTLTGNQAGGTIQWAIWHDMGFGGDDYGNGTIGGVTLSGAQKAVYSEWRTQYTIDAGSGGVWDTYKSTLVDDPTKVAWLVSDPSTIFTSDASNRQDQLVFQEVLQSQPPVPEPASLAIWSMISLGAAGVTALRRRRRQRGSYGRWSDDNRQAILSVIEGGRHA